MPATAQELELERRIEELARMGYGVDVDRCQGHRLAYAGRGGGMPWRASLVRGGTSYPEGYGFTGRDALEDAVDMARANGAT